MPEGYDSYLRGQVRELQSMVVHLDQSLTAVGGQVAQVGQEQRETRGELASLRNDFLVFVRQAELTANIQRSETKIVALENRLDIEFGHHKVVRNTAIGILQGFDIGLVSEERIRAVSEELMMQTPRYWLAPVLVALAAWVGDDQELCERAVREAFNRAPDRTALFMALVLRRQGRRDSALRWLRHYLNGQDPAALGREFAVILECISQGAFGPAAVELVQERMDAWREHLMGDDSIQAAQVRQWRQEIDKHIGGSSAAQFPRLAQASPQWPQLDHGLGRARAHESLIGKYAPMLTEEVSVSDRLEDAVDDILDRLVREYDGEELPLRRELALHETVVERGGDLAAARQSVDARTAALDSTRDLLSIQTQSALTPDDIGVSRSTQRIAVAACHDWFAQAHAAFTSEYRQALPQTVETVLDPAHNPLAQAFGLPPWRGSFGQPAAELEASLATHWDRHAEGYIAGFTAGWRTRMIVAGCVGLAALVGLGLCLGIIGVVLVVIGAGIAAATLYSRWQAALRRQEQARQQIAEAKQESIRQLRAAGAELADWSIRFREADGGEARARALIAELRTVGQGATPYERRTVSRHASGGQR